MRSWKKLSVAAVGLSLLSGCALVDSLETALTPETGQPAADTGTTVTQTAALPPDTDADRSQKDEAFVPRPKTKPEIVDPKSLVGLDKQSIEKILGAPHHITLAQPATVWVWEQDGCRMRMFFYPDLAGDKFRALTYEISAKQAKRNAMLIETCASRIKWANAGTGR